jgi:hypothetical protein
MTSRPSPALLQALALFRAPHGARPRPDERLPEGVEVLIRVAAGDAQAVSDATRDAGETSTAVREAAAFYIQQVMFATGSHSYRVLGLDADATDEQLKSHHRWLTRWLHPDRNPDEWEAIYSERVNRAWNDLRNKERRQNYDQRRIGSPAVIAPPPSSTSSAGRAVYLDGVDPGWNLRWLPRAIFGGLGLSVLMVVGLYYALNLENPSPPEEVAQTEPDAQSDSVALARARQESIGMELQAPATTPAAESVVELVPARVDNTAVEAAGFASGQPISAATLEPVRLVGPVGDRLKPPVQKPVTPSIDENAKPAVHAVVDASPAPARGIEQQELREAPRSAPVGQREANRILGRFSEVYADGNLAGMRAMFSADASSPDGGLGEILDEYDQLFERSKQRSLDMRNVTWSASGETFTVQANYVATVKSGLLRRSHFRGILRLELRQENEQWRILPIEHDERAD